MALPSTGRARSSAGSDYYAYFGEQPLLAATGEPVGARNGHPGRGLAARPHLYGGVHPPLGRACRYAAHVDRKAFSVYSQLGFFPPEAGFDGVEVSSRVPADSPRLQEYSALGLPLVGCSDSHFLSEIGGGFTEFRMAAPEFAELALALAGAEGRSVARA